MSLRATRLVNRLVLGALVIVAGVCGFGRDLAGATPPAASPKRFAIVIGANDAGRADLSRLRYADDDAVRNAEVLRALGAEVALLTTPDEETRALFPHAIAGAMPPTRSHVLQKVSELFLAGADAKARGQQVDFYFLFAGHGGFLDSGEGALFLPDGALSRRDLYDLILARSPADFNHLVVDACHAYFFVSSRGGAADVERRLEERARQYLDAQTLDRFPNTGVVVATSSADTTVEWSDYQGGVFSHEVRSALLGAADVNDDRQVTYAEIGAFIAAANSRVVHARAKLNVFVRAPARSPERPMAGWTGTPLAWLSVGSRVAGHLWIEDERGVRLSEINKSADQPVRLTLLSRERYFLRLGADEYSFLATPGQEIKVAELTATAPRTSERGSMADALRTGLFAVPFGIGFYQGYRMSLPPELPTVSKGVPEAQPPSRGVVYGLLAGAVLTSAAAVALRIESNDAYERFRQSSGADERQRWARRTNQLDWATLGATVLAVASGAGAVGLAYKTIRSQRRATISFVDGTLQASVPF